MTSSSARSTTRILFICVGNSCRSQMAESFARHLGGGRVRAWSAGSHPLGRILPHTAEVMLEKGISLDGQWSKGVEDVPVADMDVIVSMGCEVSCPVPAGFRGRIVEWNILDPGGASIEAYRSARDQIEQEVKNLLAEIPARPANTKGKSAARQDYTVREE